VLALCAFALAFFCAFVLPFRFPRSTPVYGSAYTAGENITIAAVGVALTSAVCGLIWLFSWPSRNTPTEADSAPLSTRYLWCGIGCITLCTAVLGALVVRQGDYYADAGYFLVYLRDGLRFHRTIYQQFQFDYGPLLYLWPATFIRVLARFGVSMNAAYIVSVVCMEAVGVALLFYVVNALPLRRPLKAAAFCLLTFAAFDMLLGINYAIVRCILPIATIVFLASQRSLTRAVCIACFGEMLQLFTSPELGVAFAGAAVVYGLYRAWRSGWRYLSISAATLVGVGLFSLLVPAGYLHMLHQASNGGFNIVLEPLPYVLALLFALTVLAPSALSQISLQRDTAESPYAGALLGIFIVTLGMVPAAFGRCDPLHAFVNGVGAYLLAFVAINHATLRWQRIWIAVVALTFAGTQFQEAHAFRGTIQRAFQHAPPDPWDDPTCLPSIIHAVDHAHVTLPFSYGLRMIDGLTDAGIYLPGYYNAHFDSTDAESEQRRVADMRAADFALVPIGQDLVEQDEIDNRRLKRWMLLGYTYKQRRAPFKHGTLLVEELERNWQPVGDFGLYRLYRKLR